MSESNPPLFIGLLLITFIGLIILVVSTFSLGSTERQKLGTSPEEEWSDLNNIPARDQFCKAQGYQRSMVSYTEPLAGIMYYDRAGSPGDYDIACFRMVEQSKSYDYIDYKKWLVYIETEGSKLINKSMEE